MTVLNFAVGRDAARRAGLSVTAELVVMILLSTVTKSKSTRRSSGHKTQTTVNRTSHAAVWLLPCRYRTVRHKDAFTLPS